MPGMSKDSSVGRVFIENNPAMSPLRIVVATGRLRVLGRVYPRGLDPCIVLDPGEPRGAERLGNQTGASGTGGSFLPFPWPSCPGGIFKPFSAIQYFNELFEVFNR